MGAMDVAQVAWPFFFFHFFFPRILFFYIQEKIFSFLSFFFLSFLAGLRGRTWVEIPFLLSRLIHNHFIYKLFLYLYFFIRIRRPSISKQPPSPTHPSVSETLILFSLNKSQISCIYSPRFFLFYMFFFTHIHIYIRTAQYNAAFMSMLNFLPFSTPSSTPSPPLPTSFSLSLIHSFICKYIWLLKSFYSPSLSLLSSFFFFHHTDTNRKIYS